MTVEGALQPRKATAAVLSSSTGNLILLKYKQQEIKVIKTIEYYPKKRKIKSRISFFQATKTSQKDVPTNKGKLYSIF